MNLDITKLKQETLMDIVQNVHEGAVCLEEIINVVGAPLEKNTQLKQEANLLVQQHLVKKKLGCTQHK